MSKTLRFGITVSGEVYGIAQLSAKFQIKAREYGLNDEESLAAWIEGDSKAIETNFESRQHFHNVLKTACEKLKGSPKIWEL